MITIHQRYRQTDGQTDRQTDDMRSQYRALHYSASRGKNCLADDDILRISATLWPKTEVFRLPCGEKLHDLRPVCVEIIPQRVGQTDERTDGQIRRYRS